jgi:Uma2 family endonuclease
VTRESSEVDDRGDKFNQYRLVPSLAEYVLVSSLKMQVETFYKQPDGVWAIGATISKADGVLLLRSLEMEIPLADIYAKVQLPAPVAAKTSQAEA